jgi:hypothetical protein
MEANAFLMNALRDLEEWSFTVIDQQLIGMPLI